MAKRNLVFTVDDERNHDVLAWWSRQENKSAAIRALIRKELKRSGITLGDVYQIVVEIDRKLTSGAGIVGDGDVDDATDTNEPPDVAKALDRLGL